MSKRVKASGDHVSPEGERKPGHTEHACVAFAKEPWVAREAHPRRASANRGGHTQQACVAIATEAKASQEALNPEGERGSGANA